MFRRDWRAVPPVPTCRGMSPQEVLEYANKNDARQLDLRFTDIPSLQHHVSYPITELDLDSFEEGFGMDGSSIRGWAAIHESDMLLIPDPTTAFMDPFAELPTIVMYGDVKDPITKQRYERDPRWIAQKAELFLNNSGVANKAYFGAEAEFFIFDNISFTRTTTRVITTSTPKRAVGIPGGAKTISAIGRGTRKATSRCRRRITIRTCGARWCRR
jgi:glutamine synthetase